MSIKEMLQMAGDSNVNAVMWCALCNQEEAVGEITGKVEMELNSDELTDITLPAGINCLRKLGIENTKCSLGD